MLNKKEKEIMKLVFESLESVKNISFNYETIYGTDKMIKPDTMGEEGLWRAFFDINDKILEAKVWLEGILGDKFTKKADFDTNWERKMKIREKVESREEMIKEESIKKGQKIATVRYQKISLVKDDTKKTIKSYKKGLKVGKEIAHLSNNEILNRAEMIKLNKKLGFKTEEE